MPASLWWCLTAVFVVAFAGSCTSHAEDDATAPVVDLANDLLLGDLRVRVVAEFPTSTDWSTQGLVVHDGTMVHGSGGYGTSAVRILDLATGEVVHERKLPSEVFGEGLALTDDRLFQLTWREGRLLVWSYPGLELEREIAYDGEGWGLCASTDYLVMSDGTEWLSFRDPETFAFVGNLRVVDEQGQPLRNINDLACVDGQLIANVAARDELVVIDEKSGLVEARIDASSIRPSGTPRNGDHMLNGVAIDDVSGRLFLTGKKWPVVIEVELVQVDR